jgi:two-component system phosphate regulon sensor histidine kinase PhoR
MLKKRLLCQLYFPYLLITLVALLVVIWSALHFLRNSYYERAARDLQAHARLIEQQIFPILKVQDLQGIDNLCKKLGSAGSTHITVILPNGEVIADSDEDPLMMKNHGHFPEFEEALVKDKGRSLRHSDTLGKIMMNVALPIKQQDNILAVVRTSMPVTAIQGRLKSVYKKIIWVGLIVAVCVAGVSLLVSQRISRPIKQIKRMAIRFASGDFDLRLPMPKFAELAELSQALNETARLLQDRINTITKQRNELEAILSSMIEGVLAVDTQGHIVSINNAAADLLSIEAAEAQGRAVEEVIRNVELQQFIQNTVESGQSTESEIFLPTDGGRFFRLHGASLSDNEGSRHGAVIVLNDTTRMRRLEDIRRDFVANVSHELKTPVTSIKGFVETLLQGTVNEPEQVNRFLKIIAKHSDRLNTIIEDLLSLSRLEEDAEKGKISFEKTYLKPVLQAAIELSDTKTAEKQIEIDLTCEDHIEANINAALLEHAVVNLIDNAIKYSQPGSEVQINVQQKDKEIAISVQDSGCGIEEKHLSRIFERFYVVDKARSRKLGGTGLGLAIVKHIAQAHGGYVTVESSPGVGSTFTIHFPTN